MTSPIVVGSVAVDVEVTGRGFARRLRDALVKEFESAGFDKALTDALGKKKLKVPVEPVFDDRKLPKTPTRTPQRRPDTDPLLKAFQQDIQRQITALAKQSLKLPVTPDVEQFRAELGDELRQISRKLKAEIPTEPGERRAYERDLRGMVDAAAEKIRIRLPAPEIPAPKIPQPKPVKIPLDPLTREFQADIQRQLAALSKTANAKIPVTAETAPLRARAAAAIAEVERTLKAEIPTEPAGRAAYEAKLRAMVAVAEKTVKANIPVEVDQNRFQRAVARLAASLPAGLAAPFRSLGEAANTAGSAVASASTSLAGMVNPASLATVAIGGAVAALFLIGPAAGAAAGAIGVLAGALASLPALGVGGLGILGSFGLALKGVGEAFKDVGKAAGGGGRSASQGARQIASARRAIEAAERGVAAAERNLANAQRDALRAQEDINRARKAAQERIEDLGRALRGAHLDEREATIRLREALEELELARLKQAEAADPDDIRHIRAVEKAQLAYEQAVLALENAQDATADLTEEKTDSDRKGVEGSDEVTAAYERQREAQERVVAAQESLKSAQDALIAANEQLAAAQEKVGGSAGGAAKQMTKLAPAARKFVDAVKMLKPAFEDLRLEVQERFFKGLDKTVTSVGKTWIPVLKEQLGGFADTFNQFFKDLGTSITTPKFVKDISTALTNFRTGFLDPILKAISKDGVEAFGSLARAAKPFTDALGRNLAGFITKFSQMVKDGEKSGKLDRFFTKAGEFLDAAFAIGEDVLSIMKSLTEILFGVDDEGGSGIVEAFDKLAKFLKDPENRKQLAEYINKFREIGRFLLVEVIPRVTKFLFVLGTVENRISGFANKISNSVNRAREAINLLIKTISEIPEEVEKHLTDTRNRATSLVTGTWNKIRSLFEGGVSRAVNAASALPGRVGAALNPLNSQMGSRISSAVNNAVSTLSGMPGRAQTAVSGVSSAVVRGVGDLSRTLYNAGRALIDGLIKGVQSKLPGLGTFLDGVSKFIQDHKGPLDEDRKLLVPAGQAIMAGLVAGIASQRPALRRELAAVTADVAGGVQADVAARVQASVAAPLDVLSALARTDLARPDTGPPDVRVFIGDRELTDIVRVEVSEKDRRLKRRAVAAGTAR